jgi:hypothetical protein
VTAPPDAPQRVPRERRPPLVELAAALLTVTGTVQLISALGVVATGNLQPGTEGLLAVSIGLDVGTIVAGLLTRAGLLWLLVVNYVAVLGFLDLLRAPASPVAVMLAAVDLFVLYVLFTNRSWFGRTPGDDGGAERAADDDREESLD